MSNKINIKNYEEFVLDYIEDNLDDWQRADFERFLVEHQDIAATVTSLIESMPRAEADTEITYPQKSSLKRRSLIRKFVYYSSGIAAAAIFGIFVFHSFYKLEPSLLNNIELAVVDSVEVAKTDIVHSGEILANNTMPIVKNSKNIVAQNPVKASPAKTFNNVVLAVASVKVEAQTPIDQAPIVASIAEAEAMIADNIVKDITFAEFQPALSATDAIVSTQDEELSNGEKFKKTLGGKMLRSLVERVMVPIGSIAPIDIYTNNDERVVEFATITISRKQLK